MDRQFYSVLFHDRNHGAALVITASCYASEALVDAQELAPAENLGTAVLGVFPGALQPALVNLPFHPRMDRHFTEAARALDTKNADALMLDDWTKIDPEYYVATICPPCELRREWGSESVVITFDGLQWWLSSSDAVGQSDFLFLTDAVTAANQTIKKIRERFQEALAPIAH